MSITGSLWKEIAAGAAFAALGFLARWLLDPFLGPLQPFAPGYVAVTASGWFVGWRGGVATAVLAYLWGTFFFIEPRGEFAVATGSGLASLLTNALSSGLLIFVTHRARVAERRVVAANAELQRADRQKNEFLATLSHELRNPVGVLLNVTDLLDRPDLPPDRLHEISSLARHQVLHIKRLLDDLLDIGRIARGRLAIHRETADLRQCIADAVTATRHAFERKRQAVKVDVPGGPVLVHHDVVRMTQVLVILLDNACKYAPAEARVLVRLVAGSEATLTVSDTGPGIDPRLANRVFEGVGHAAPTPHGSQGLGIGLPLAKHLVELHDGTIRLERTGGPGATFVITLPRASDPAPSPPRAAHPPASAVR